MAKLIKGRNNGTLQNWEKGESGNPNGRPRKYVSLLKENGYKLSEINDTIQNMMAMKIDELDFVFKSDTTTILEKTIAGAMIKSLKNGSLYSLDTLLSRVYGKPKEMAEITNEGRIEVIFTRGKTIL